MSKGIIVEMPERLYISYSPDRTLENEFYFVIYKQYRSQACQGTAILQSPFITINGFEQLVRIPQKTKEEQDAQIEAAGRRFVGQLSVDPSWAAACHYDSATENLAVVLTCTEPDLAADFKVRIFTDNFICSLADTHQPVILTIHTEGFEELFGDTEKYSDYQVCIHGAYAPCITEFKVRCGGVDYTDQVYVNPRFDNPLTFHWKIMGNGKLEHTLQKGDTYIKAASTADTIEDTVDAAVVYTLDADNLKGFTDWAQISVAITGWHKAGSVVGLPGDARTARDIAGVARYGNAYYCYSSAVLYRSEDGCRWTEYSKNTEAGEGKRPCTACRLCGDSLYIMAGNVGERLKIMRFHFADKQWEISPAYQNCVSADGHLAFSAKYSYYAQTAALGMVVSGHDDKSDWFQWNRINFDITPEGKRALYSDLCFWKDRFYAVILCDDEKFYFYECREETEEALFVCEAGGKGRISLLPTANRLFVAVNGRLYDTDTREAADSCFPPAGEGGCCLGSDQEGIFGIFGDGNFWIYK